MSANLRTTDPATTRRRRSIRASAPLGGWRTVDLLTIAFLGVAFGIAYWGWGFAYRVPSEALGAIFPPLGGITSAPWLVAGVVGGLVVRRPGAALFCEVLAALVSMLPGTQWGFGTFLAGVLQGVGAELAFAALGYASFGIGAAALAGALSSPLEVVYEWFTYYPDWAMAWKVAYLGIGAVAGAVIAGGLGIAITRALATAGALNAFPPGQELRERHAV